MKCTAIDRHTFKDSTKYKVVFDTNCTDDTRDDDIVVKFN